MLQLVGAEGLFLKIALPGEEESHARVSIEEVQREQKQKGN